MMTQNSTPFEGKAGLVTGAGSGIGEATAKLFARRGAAVTVVDVNRDSGDRVVEEIKTMGGTARLAYCDVTKPDDVARMVDDAVAAFATLDFAFNNAGITGYVGPTADVPVDDWQAVIDLDLTAVFYCMKYEIPHMVRQGRGAIVNTSSDAGIYSVRNIAPYVAANDAIVDPRGSRC